VKRGALPRRVVRRIRQGVEALLAPRPGAPSGTSSSAMDVVFVGGTGRSGTTILGHLIGAHPEYAVIPSESKFITGPRGLCDLASGKATLAEFEATLLGRRLHTRFGRGLHTIVDPAAVESALPALRERLPAEPWAAAAEFAHTLLDPIPLAKGARAWVDQNPGNVFRARELLHMFPNMRLVHSVRDGRDVASSVTPLPWGPDDFDEALDWWGHRVERAFAACEQVPAERVLVVQLEALVAGDRDREFARLLAFLGLDDDPSIRTYFEDHLTEAQSHIGRWRQDVPADRMAAFQAHHERIAEGLRDRGRTYTPVAEPGALTPVG
jgi:Sulfotransferase family